MSDELRAAAERLRNQHENYYLDDCPPARNDLYRWIDDLQIVKDAYLAEHDDTPIDEAWLREMGFLPDGDDSNKADFGYLVIKGIDDETHQGEDTHIVCDLVDQRCYLESYDWAGETIALIDLGNLACGDLLSLLRALGKE